VSYDKSLIFLELVLKPGLPINVSDGNLTLLATAFGCQNGSFLSHVWDYQWELQSHELRISLQLWTELKDVHT
jgi:hypothetical protein